MNRKHTAVLIGLALGLLGPAAAPALADGKPPLTATATATPTPTPARRDRGVTERGDGHAPERLGRGRRPLHGVVNLNQADEATLQILPGVGEVKASRIVAWRQTHAFKKVEDLDRVKGFGRKTLTRLKPFLSVSGASTLSEETQAPAAAE